MDAHLFAEAMQYEQLTRSIYQSLLHQEGIENIQAKRNTSLAGRSGVQHQVDVMWKFKQVGVIHTVLIECKNYSSAVSLEKVRNFFAVLHDIGNCVGLMVTRVGYQRGAAEFAKYYGIRLKLLRRPNEEDWRGRIKNLHFELATKSLVSNPEQPVKVHFDIGFSDEVQEARLALLAEHGKLKVAIDPYFRFCDSSGDEHGEELCSFLPRVIKVLEKEDGGPYEERIELDNAYIWVNRGMPEQELVRVAKLVVTYYVETVELSEMIINGEEVVQAVLKDHFTNEVEYTKFFDQ